MPYSKRAHTQQHGTKEEKYQAGSMRQNLMWHTASLNNLLLYWTPDFTLFCCIKVLKYSIIWDVQKHKKYVCLGSYRYALHSRQTQNRVKSIHRTEDNMGESARQTEEVWLSPLPLRKIKVNKAKCQRERKTRGLNAGKNRLSTQQQRQQRLYQHSEQTCL